MPPFRREFVEEAESYYRAPIIAQVDQANSEQLEVDNSLAVFALESIDMIRFHEDLDKTQSLTARLHMIDAVADYISDREAGMEASELKRHQQGVFHDILLFLENPPLHENGEPKSRGYVKQPTATGKTALLTTLANVFNRKNKEHGPTLKGVILVPRLDLVSQTIGEDGDRGFARFGPETDISEYHGTVKDLEGDTVVMTYQSMIHALKKEAIDEHTFDYFICDEAHRALGVATLETLEQVTKDKVVIGLTATTDYAENKRVDDFFDHNIHSMDFHEAIEQSLLAPIQAHLIASDEKIAKLKVGEYSTAELADLIDDEWSNKKAIEFTKAYLESGRQGIISCVPGADTRHAKEMALQLNQEFIIDPKTSDLRRVRAVEMSGGSKDREATYKAFERGEIDVLTYVDLLTEGWDSKKAKFLINLRPTASPVTAMQRLGRILRQNDEEQSAVVLEVLRRSPKPQYTFWEALGEETFDYRKTWPGGSSNKTSPDKTPNDPTIALPRELIDELQSVQHKTIRELVIDPSQPSSLIEGFMRIDVFSKTLDVSPMTIRAVMQEKALEGEEYKVYLNEQGKPGIALSTEQQQTITDELERKGLLLDRAPEGYISLLALANRLRTSRLTLDKIVGELEETGEAFPRYKFFNKKAVGVSPEQQKKIADRPEFSIQRPDKEIKSINVFKDDLGVGIKRLRAVVTTLEAEGETFGMYMFGTKIAVGLSLEQQEKIRERPELSTPDQPEGYTSINKLAHGTEMSEGYIRRVIENLAEDGEEFGTYLFHGKPGLGISPEQQAKIKGMYYTAPIAPLEDYVSVNSLTKKHGISLQTVNRVVERLEAAGEKVGMRKIRGKDLRILSPEQYARFLDAPELHIKQAPEGYASITAFSKKLGVKYAEFSEFIKELKAEGETFETYRFGSAVITDALSPEQQEKIANMPRFKGLPFAPEDYQTAEEFAVQHELGLSKVKAAMLRLKKEGETFDRYKFGKRKLTGISPEQAGRLLKLPLLVASDPPEGVVTTSALATELGVTSSTVAKRIEQLRAEGEEFTDYNFRTRTTIGISPEQQTRIKALLGK